MLTHILTIVLLIIPFAVPLSALILMKRGGQQKRQKPPQEHTNPAMHREKV